MKYSFVIPVYNCKAYLEGCVASICSVQGVDYEVLLVDDGSTDGSGALCDTLAETYPQVRVIHQENGGASAARNRGIRESQGENLLFIDADDVIDAAALGAILADARCGQADLTIFGLTFDYYRKGRCYRSDALWHDHDGVFTKEAWGTTFSDLYQKNSLSPVWNKVFKRDILRRCCLELDAGMFLYEDFEFVLRYMAHCGDIWNVPKAVYHYRQSEDEGNAKRRLRRVESINDFLQPIEAAMEALVRANSVLQQETADDVLLRLYLVLAREKISVSSTDEVRRICREFAEWSARKGIQCHQDAKFQERLLRGKAASLILADRKTALRHKLAVWVKSKLYLKKI